LKKTNDERTSKTVIKYNPKRECWEDQESDGTGKIN
jgi:hypothetical protein